MRSRSLPRARKMAKAATERDWVAVRIRMVSLLFAAGLAALFGRALWLQVLDNDLLQKRAEQMHSSEHKLTCPRGTIYDRNGEVLAYNVDGQSVFAEPRNIPEQDKQRIADRLALLLGMDRDRVLAGLNRTVNGRPAGFAWIKRHVSRDQAEMIALENLPGIHMEKESQREYPNRSLAANVLGFTNIDSEGLSGLELSYESCLRGTPGRLIGRKDALGRTYYPEGIHFVGSKPGAGMMLTLDSKIQAIAERELDRTFKESEAQSATLIVMDVRTGEILAMVSRPTFDPNVANRFPIEFHRNRAVGDRFEPGSSLKVFTYAAAIEAGTVKPTDTIDCENGAFPFGIHVIHDFHKHDLLTAREVIAVSSNIGATKMAVDLGAERLHAALGSFGFGRITGVDVPSEASGCLRSLERWHKIDVATHSYGQGISVTTLQLVTALSAAVNGGVLLKPYLVDRIVAPDGRELYGGHPMIRARVVNESTSREVLQTLITVTQEGGTGTQAALPYCLVAGKTGTAQKPFDDRRGYSDEVVAVFMGVVPAEDPRLAIAVVIDEPQGPRWKRYGGTVAAPVFRKVADESMAYLRMIPGNGPQEMLARPMLAADRVDQSRDGGLPDFAGLSVRQAYALAESRGILLEIEGSGIAVTQYPPPGSPVVDETRVRVRFTNPGGVGG